MLLATLIFGVPCRNSDESGRKESEVWSVAYFPRQNLDLENRLTVLAGPHFFRIVELLRDRGQLRYNLLGLVEFKIGLVNARVAVLAKPDTTIFLPRLATGLDHHADRVSRTARRVKRLGRQQKHIALGNDDVLNLLIDNHFERNRTFNLIEQLLAFVVVKVTTRIGAADDHDDQIIRFRVDALIANRRLERAAILFDPLNQVEGLFEHEWLTLG